MTKHPVFLDLCFAVKTPISVLLTVIPPVTLDAFVTSDTSIGVLIRGEFNCVAVLSYFFKVEKLKLSEGTYL